jgi:hypothetical protein
MTRAIAIEVMGSDYIRYARACGFPRRVVRRIALRAALVPVIMAEKARLYGPDKMTERWNGRGKAWEDTGDDYVRADSGNHARKVEEAMRMLKHPANKQLYNEYLYRMLTE